MSRDIRALRDNQELWEILEERAHLLALQQIDADIEQGEEVVTFRMGEEGFSIPARFVREVQPFQNWTPIPTTPAFVVGLVNVRGKILTALDIRPLLDMAQTPPDKEASLIILTVQGTEVGLLADRVEEVRRGERELSPTLSAVAGHGVAWVRGLDSNLNLVLDPPVLLSDPRFIINDEST